MEVENKVAYSIPVLVALLEEFHQYTIAHPEILVMGRNGVNVVNDDVYEKAQDVIYNDLQPGQQMAYEYTHYLAKHPKGTEHFFPMLYNAITSICNRLLITENGDCNWANHRQLENHGYRVRAGERDSFGWLSGRVCHKDFEVYFG